MWTDDYQLADPPREVSGLLQLQVLFRSGAQGFAWPWIFFWGFVLWLFVGLGGMDFATEVRFLATSVERTKGKITGCEGTNTEINERTVNAFEFVFTDAQGGQHTATSYSQQSYMAVGAPVSVEYLSAAPGKARIVGMRLSSLPLLVVGIMGVFPGVGVLLILFGLRKGLKARRLLARGRMALASVLRQEATGTRINEKPVMKITYSFTDDEGQTHRFMHKTHEIEAITDDSGGERILYDPQDPSSAFLLDELPGSGYVSPNGAFQPSGSAVEGLKMPALTLLVHGGIFVAWILQGLG
jgi:uncharacterized protein DUF3592